jgi:ABC-type glycerol-3-phosphate transport system substrate-binding protein
VHGHAITSGSQEQEGAWELVKYILSDAGQETIAKGGRMCGTPEKIDSIWGPIASKDYNFTNIDAFSNGMREGATPLIMGQGAEIHSYGGGPITALWDAVLGLQKEPAQALAEANPEIQRILDTYWRDRT